MTEQPPQPPQPRALVAGEFVEYAPGRFVRAAAVMTVEGGEAMTFLGVAAPAEDVATLTSDYAVHTVVAALNLALQRSRERVAVTREA